MKGMLKWSDDRIEEETMPIYACNEAAKSGNLEALKLVRENGCPWNETICARAARGGHLDVLKWAIENGCAYKTPDVFKKRSNSLPWDASLANRALCSAARTQKGKLICVLSTRN